MRAYTVEQLNAEFRALCAEIERTVSPFGDVEDDADRAARVERCRRDVKEFAQTYFPQYVRQPFAPMHDEMIRICRRRNVPQVVAGFRGSAKSTIIDFFMPMHEIVYQTCHFYMFGSASTDIAVAEYALPILAHLKTNPRLIADFGQISVDGEQHDFMAGEVRVLSFGRRSSVKGKKNGPWRPDRIRLADIEDRNNMMSPLVVRKTADWIENDVLESVGAGIDEEWSVVYEFNYFSRRTVGHTLMNRENWQRVVFPALVVGPRNKLVSSWPERYPTAMLEAKRREAPLTFEVEWQQSPRDDEDMFRRDWIHYVEPKDVPWDHLSIFGWCDPSASEKDTADYKAYGYVGVTPEMDVFVLRVHVRHETTLAMVRAMYEMQRTEPRIRLWGFEGIVFETLLRDIVETEGVTSGMYLPFMPITKNFSAFPMKRDRIPKMQPLFERGKVFFVRAGADEELLIQQILDYPNTKNDDGPDMLSGAVELAQVMGPKQELLVKL